MSYRNAKEILKISDVFSTSESVFEYEKMDLELLFMNLKKSNIETFKKKCLKDFSLKEIKEFSVILSVYEKFNGSITKTSEELFMHKNTLQYKLAKIKKLVDTIQEILETLLSSVLLLNYGPLILKIRTILIFHHEIKCIKKDRLIYPEYTLLSFYKCINLKFLFKIDSIYTFFSFT